MADAPFPIAEILQRKYPELQWRLEENDYDRLTVYNGETPKYEELEAFAAEVIGLLAVESAERDRTTAFQVSYPIQRQLDILRTAIVKGDLSAVTQMDLARGGP